MAFYDHAAEAHRQRCQDKYEELKKFITSIEEKGKNKGKVSEWFLAHEHVMQMEHTINKQQKRLEEYGSFFSSLSALLPRKSSIHDIIG
jgi:hypothetical protein